MRWMIVLLAWTALAGLFSNAVFAQKNSSRAQVDPQIFGFDIPNGRVRPGEDRCVQVRDNVGEMVVAKIYVEVGENVILLFPDGQLVARPKLEVQGSTKPFVAASKESLATSIAEKEFPGFRVRQTKHYVYVYNSTEGFATVTGRILESMMPGVLAYCESQGIRTEKPEVPLIVVMYRTEREYRQATGMPPGLVAFYDSVSNRVYMFESGGLEAIDPDFAARDAVSTIAHEGAHQILANCGVQVRLSRWPMWVQEGLAEFYSPTTVDRNFKWKGAAQTNEIRMIELHNHLLKREYVPTGQSVIDIVEAADLSSPGYAAAWSLVHYLSQNQRQAFNGYVRELSKLGPLEGDYVERRLQRNPKNRALFEKQFGSDFVATEKKLMTHLNNLAK